MPKIPPQKKGSPILGLIALTLLISVLYTVFHSGFGSQYEDVTINEFISDVESGPILSIEIDGNQIQYDLIDTSGVEIHKTFTKENGQTIYDLLESYGISSNIVDTLPIEILNTTGRDFWLNLLLSALPIFIVIGLLYFMMRGAAGSNNQAMSFGKSNARLYDKEKSIITFKDVAGIENAKEELEEIADFLKNPSKYTAMGAKIPKGVLLVGHPGTGKTLLARAIAGEAKVPFFSISGSEFVEMFVGVGASRVRDLFKKAKRNAPCLIFIDEIDAVGRRRGAGMGGGHDEREQTLNQILTEMDGFETNTNVIMIAATNRPDVLDPALLRPGRFDRRVVVDLPSLKDREAILKVHARNKPLDKDVNLETIAKRTPGLSGADLENLLNESAILAAKNGQKTIRMKDIENSIEKTQLGRERKAHVLSKKEREVTAYHEMGHAIVGHVLEDCDPVQKITIVSRGMSLGSTWFVPDEDSHLYTRQKFEHEMASLMGGYVAEEMIFGQTSTGPSNDLERAGKMARQMVTKYGMSAKLGPMVFGDQNDEVFLGRDFGHIKNYSETSASAIDSEVTLLIQNAYHLAKKLLTKYKKQLVEMSKELLKRETLDREEFIELFGTP